MKRQQKEKRERERERKRRTPSIEAAGGISEWVGEDRCRRGAVGRLGWRKHGVTSYEHDEQWLTWLSTKAVRACTLAPPARTPFARELMH